MPLQNDESHPRSIDWHGTYKHERRAWIPAPWDTSLQVAAVRPADEGTVRADARPGAIGRGSSRSMTLVLAAVGAIVTAVLELSAGPYLRFGTAQPHLVLVF